MQDTIHVHASFEADAWAQAVQSASEWSRSATVSAAACKQTEGRQLKACLAPYPQRISCLFLSAPLPLHNKQLASPGLPHCVRSLFPHGDLRLNTIS